MIGMPNKAYYDTCDIHGVEVVYNQTTWAHECPKCLEPTAENMARLLEMIRGLQRDMHSLEYPNDQD